ncbi:MAG: hypothetical protein K6E85_05650 [Lachnospiraceae bacterium]|nr:hypothetical protein [Lachnospiraceae bacterium]
MSRILIVDDEADIVSLIERYAKREGYEVETASDSGEAIEACIPSSSNEDTVAVTSIVPPLTYIFR